MLNREILRVLAAFIGSVVLAVAISATCSIRRFELVLLLSVYLLGVLYAFKDILQRIGKTFSMFFQAQLFSARILGALVLFFGLSAIVLLGWFNGMIKLIKSLIAAKKLDENIY